MSSPIYTSPEWESKGKEYAHLACFRLLPFTPVVILSPSAARAATLYGQSAERRRLRRPE